MRRVSQNNLTLALLEFAMACLKSANDLVGAEKSGGGPPHSKTLARRSMAPEQSEASWAAPVLARALSLHHSTFGSYSSATEILPVLKREIDFTIAGEAVRSNHAAEHHGY